MLALNIAACRLPDLVVEPLERVASLQAVPVLFRRPILERAVFRPGDQEEILERAASHRRPVDSFADCLRGRQMPLPGETPARR